MSKLKSQLEARLKIAEAATPGPTGEGDDEQVCAKCNLPVHLGEREWNDGDICYDCLQEWFDQAGTHYARDLRTMLKLIDSAEAVVNDSDLKHEDASGNLDRLREALADAEKESGE